MSQKKPKGWKPADDGDLTFAVQSSHTLSVATFTSVHGGAIARFDPVPRQALPPGVIMRHRAIMVYGKTFFVDTDVAFDRGCWKVEPSLRELIRSSPAAQQPA